MLFEHVVSACSFSMLFQHVILHFASGLGVHLAKACDICLVVFEPEQHIVIATYN